MGIHRLRVAGFRSLRDVTWQPGRLNLLIGANGAGKSNLMRALALLRDAARGDLPTAILRQGGIAPLMWDAQATELVWELRSDPPPPQSEADRHRIDYELRIAQVGRGSTYRIEQERLTNNYLYEHENAAAPFKYLERDTRHAVVFDSPRRRLRAIEGTVPEDQTLLSLGAGPFGNPMVATFRDRLASWNIYHDVRVDEGATIRQSAVARHETRVSSDGENLIPVLHTLYETERNFRDLVDGAMHAAFGTAYERLAFPPAADQRVQLRVAWRTLRSHQPMADLSDGTIRFLLLLAILGSPDPADLIAIDEPETGLHPDMLAIVAELAEEASERTQVILATHSSELLNAFRRPPTTTVTRWHDGATELAMLGSEELDVWLKGYSLGAAFRSGELEALA